MNGRIAYQSSKICIITRLRFGLWTDACWNRTRKKTRNVKRKHPILNKQHKKAIPTEFLLLLGFAVIQKEMRKKHLVRIHTLSFSN